MAGKRLAGWDVALATVTGVYLTGGAWMRVDPGSAHAGGAMLHWTDGATAYTARLGDVLALRAEPDAG